MDKLLIYLNGVNGGLVWYKRSQEALIAQFTNVTRHMTSVDQDF